MRIWWIYLIIALISTKSLILLSKLIVKSLGQGHYKTNMEIPEYFAKEALSLLQLRELIMASNHQHLPPLFQIRSLNDRLWKFQLYYALPIRRKELYILYVSEQLLRKTMHSRTQQLTNKTHWFGVTLTNNGILTVRNESFLSSQPAQDVSGSNTYDLFGMNVTTLWSAVQFSTSFVRISLLSNITNNLFLYFHTKMNSK